MLIKSSSFGKILAFCTLLFLCGSYNQLSAQSSEKAQKTQTGDPAIDNWIFNQNGQIAIIIEHGSAGPMSINYLSSGDSADVLEVCYNSDFVWVRAEGLADTMGLLITPATPVAQDFVRKFPRVPTPATSATAGNTLGMIGLLLNGVAIDSRGNNSSYNNLGIWNGDVGLTEINSLDERFNGHAAMDQRYHTHATPYYLDLTSATEHSNLVGFAYDGYPIYGPKGYSDPMDETSPVTRMTSGYELRNISVRDSLPEPNGLLANSSDWGPVVDTANPLGTFSEDYAFTVAGADLDENNGRFCKTPEYPNGVYAYFCAEDIAGSPIYPYIIGPQYHGVPEPSNIGPMSNLSLPNTGCFTQHLTAVEDAFVLGGVKLYPNPTKDILNIELAETNTGVAEITLFDARGIKVLQQRLEIGHSKAGLDLSSLGNGVYILQLSSMGQSYSSKVIIR